MSQAEPVETTFEIPKERLYNPTNQDDVRMIPLSKLIPDNQGIRASVHKQHNGWPEFVKSIMNDGVKKSILVRQTDAEGGEVDKFIIINGFRRHSGAMEALDLRNEALEAQGRAQISVDEVLIPAIVLRGRSLQSCNKLEILKLQLITNAHTIQTRPIQYSEHLQRFMTTSGFTCTIEELSAIVAISPAWVSNMLKLAGLSAEAKKYVEEAGVTAANAYHLSRLEEKDQKHFLDLAGGMNAPQFAEAVGNYLADLKTKAKGEKPDPNEIRATAKHRTRTRTVTHHRDDDISIPSPTYCVVGRREQNVRLRFSGQPAIEWLIGRSGAGWKYLNITKDGQDLFPFLRDSSDADELSHLTIALAVTMSGLPPSTAADLTDEQRKSILKRIRDVVVDVVHV